jgi:hypothetical protein
MDSTTLFDQLANRGAVVALIPHARDNDPGPHPAAIPSKWYTVRKIADMLSTGCSKPQAKALPVCIKLGEVGLIG